MYMFVYAKTVKEMKSGSNYVFHRKATGFPARQNFLNFSSDETSYMAKPEAGKIHFEDILNPKISNSKQEAINYNIIVIKCIIYRQ